MTRLLAAGLALLALAALLLAVLGSRSRPQRPCGEPVALFGVAYGEQYDPCVKPRGHSGYHDPSPRPFPLATGNGRHPHTGVHDPYLERLR
jgi:hypothetical protein